MQFTLNNIKFSVEQDGDVGDWGWTARNKAGQCIDDGGFWGSSFEAQQDAICWMEKQLAMEPEEMISSFGEAYFRSLTGDNANQYYNHLASGAL